MDQIIDKRKNTKSSWQFWAIPKDVFGDKSISFEARVLFGIIFTMMNGENKAWPGQRYLAELMGRGERSIRRYIDELVECELVEVQRMGVTRTNRYIVIGQFGRSREDADVRSREATVAGHSKRTIEKNIVTKNASPSGNGSALEVFDLKAEIQKLKDSPQRHIQLIGEFLEEKSVRLENKAQLKRAIARHLKAARALADFSDKQIGEATRVAMREYPAYTLETLVKVLTR